MNENSMKITNRLLLNLPALAESVTSVESLVMNDALDLTAGDQIMSALENEQVIAVGEGEQKFTIANESTIALIDAMLSVATEAEKAEFKGCLDKLNGSSQALYSKYRADLVKSVSKVSDVVSEAGVGAVTGLAAAIRNNTVTIGDM